MKKVNGDLLKELSKEPLKKRKKSCLIASLHFSHFISSQESQDHRASHFDLRFRSPLGEARAPEEFGGKFWGDFLGGMEEE